MKNKGFPYREKKKDKIIVTVDKRPHIIARAATEGWWRRLELEKITNFHAPDWEYLNKLEKPHIWTRDEARSLIEAYAKIAWKDKNFRPIMPKIVSQFISLWNKQKGLCAISGLPLFGSPDLLGYGIGIDLLRRKRGLVKGNVRLVSCPLAIVRYRSQNYCSQIIEKPLHRNYVHNEKFYELVYIIAHSFYKYLVNNKSFKNLPVKIYFSPQGLINFCWQYRMPTNNTWQIMKYDDNRYDTFFRVTIDDGQIRLQSLNLRGDFIPVKETAKLNVLSLDWRDSQRCDYHCDKKFDLADPTIDFFSEIVKEARICLTKGLNISIRTETDRMIYGQ